MPRYEKFLSGVEAFLEIFLCPKTSNVYLSLELLTIKLTCDLL